MTTRERTSPQIQPYLDVLETRLGSLPTEERIELLGDLESHLEEILADEPDTPLSDRIGTPDRYADEFLGSVGIPGAPGTGRSAADVAADWIRRITGAKATSRARDLWEELRPAWWTIRGLAIGLLVAWNYLGPGDPGALWVMQIVAGVTLIGFIWVSMRLGHNRERSTAWKWLSITGTVIGLFAMFALSANISARLDPYTYESGQYPVFIQDSSPYGSLTEEDFRVMSETGMTPEEYFDSGYFQDLREDGFVPPVAEIPSDPPLIIVP